MDERDDELLTAAELAELEEHRLRIATIYVAAAERRRKLAKARHKAARKRALREYRAEHDDN